MDLKIKTFLKLYETMNYHETARLLNMTQPGVTQQIKSLEAEYGCSFFIYDRKKLTRTRDAEIFEEYARSAVFNHEKLCGRLSRPAARHFRIGVTKSIGEYMIRDMTAAFLSDMSRTADITVDNTERLLHLLDDNRLDFALVEGAFSKVRYESRLFRSEPLCGICAKGRPLAGKTVALEELFSETLILREPGSGTRGIFSGLLAERGYSKENFSRVVSVSEFSLLAGLVASGVGISFVYDAVAKHEPEVDRFSIDGISPIHELNYVFLKHTVAPSLIEEYDAYRKDA